MSEQSKSEIELAAQSSFNKNLESGEYPFLSPSDEYAYKLGFYQGLSHSAKMMEIELKDLHKIITKHEF